MTRAERRAVVGILVGVAIGAAVAVAGSQRGATVAGWPVFAVCAALSFAIIWLVFVPHEGPSRRLLVLVRRRVRGSSLSTAS